MPPEYKFKRIVFKLFLTGDVEQRSVREILRQIVADQNQTWTESGGQPVEFDSQCEFVKQQTPRKGVIESLKMTGTAKNLPTVLEERISLPALAWLRNNPDGFVILIDDLESSRRNIAPEVFKNYRLALNKTLFSEELRNRASVHFFINMLEAYYFTQPEVVNPILGIDLVEPSSDVEEINHPKNRLDSLMKQRDASAKFKEIEHGSAIIGQLNLERVLNNPKTCRSLRTLVGWCRHRLGATFDQRWRLVDGEFHPLTRDQIPWPLPSPEDAQEKIAK